MRLKSRLQSRLQSYVLCYSKPSVPASKTTGHSTHLEKLTLTCPASSSLPGIAMSCPITCS